jgi:tetratricopeptide (TPR) repeat protein
MIAESPQEKNFWIWQANAFLSDQSIEQAAANLEILKRMGKADAPSLGLLGDIYLNRGMSELALENYLAAADLGTLSPERLLSTTQSLVSRQLWEQADTYLKETSAIADSLSQEQTMSYLNLRARVALGTGDLPAASEILNAVVAQDPMNGEALLSLGNLEREMENYEAAIFAYEQAAKIDETKVNALVEHARMLVGMRDYDAAVVVLRRAVVLEPGPRLETYLERVESAARAASGRI